MNIQKDMIRINNRLMAGSLKRTKQRTIAIKIGDTTYAGEIVSIDGITITIKADPRIVEYIRNEQESHKFVSMGIQGVWNT